MRLLSAIPLLLVITVSASSQTPAATAPPAAPATFSGVTTSLLLDGALSSYSAHEGQKVTAYFRKNTTLPTGEVFPIHTVLRGHVLKVSKKSKDKPAGVVEIVFDVAAPKKAPEVPVMVKIKTVDSPGADETSGPSTEKKDDASAAKVPDKTGIPNVFLQVPADGSAIFYTPGADVEVEDSVQMTAVIAKKP